MKTAIADAMITLAAAGALTGAARSRYFTRMPGWAPESGARR
jgi:hypothetical protein